MIELVAEMQSSIVVEHSPHYPKVMVLSPARVAGTERETITRKNCSVKIVIVSLNKLGKK
jgi:hypothetical protein